MQLHKLRIDTFCEASLRCDIYYHYAFLSLGKDAEGLHLVAVDIHHRDFMQRLIGRLHLLFAPSVQGD